MVKIRAATFADLSTLMELIHLKAQFDGCPAAVTATRDRLQHGLFSDLPLCSVLLAEVDGQVVGFASYYAIYSTFLAKPGIWLEDLFVKAPYRHQRIGQTLMMHLCQIAQSNGCERVDWTVAVQNTSGQRFYQRIGATISDRVKLCRLNGEAIARLSGLLCVSDI